MPSTQQQQTSPARRADATLLPPPPPPPSPPPTWRGRGCTPTEFQGRAASRTPWFPWPPRSYASDCRSGAAIFNRHRDRDWSRGTERVRVDTGVVATVSMRGWLARRRRLSADDVRLSHPPRELVGDSPGDPCAGLIVGTGTLIGWAMTAAAEESVWKRCCHPEDDPAVRTEEPEDGRETIRVVGRTSSARILLQCRPASVGLHGCSSSARPGRPAQRKGGRGAGARRRSAPVTGKPTRNRNRRRNLIVDPDRTGIRASGNGTPATI